MKKNLIFSLMVMTILMVGAVSAIEITAPSVEPTNPQTTSTMTICADVDGEGLVITSVELNCDSGDHSVHDAVMQNDGTGRYCTSFSFTNPQGDTTVQDDEYMDCVITAEDEESNPAEPVPIGFTYDGEEPTADAGDDQEVDEGEVVTFEGSGSEDSVTDSEDLNYSWDFGDESPIGYGIGLIAPTHTYADNGVYEVTLTVEDEAGFNDSDTMNVTVNDIDPEADFSWILENLNEGEEVQFTDESDSYDEIISWLWDFGDGETSNLQNPTHTYADDGTYTVTLTVYEEDEDSDDATYDIEIANVAPEFNETGPFECDEGETISLTASATDVEADYPLGYEWDLDGDDIFETPGQSVNYTCGDNDEVTVVVKATDKDEEFTIADVEITINNVPPTANAGGPYQGVINEGIQLSGSATDDYDTEFTYEWDCDYDGEFVMDFSGQIVSCVYEEPGTYTAALRVNDGDDYSEIAEAEVNVSDYNITLSNGWNLFSIPLVPADTSIDDVLGEEVSSNAEVIWAYVYDEEAGENVWKYNMPIDGNWDSERTLNNIIPGYGYYIKMNGEVTIYNDGERMYGNDEFTVPKPPVVTLTPSWNLIGHYGMEEEIDKDSALDTLDSSYSTLLDKDGIAVSEMNPKKGYWLFITGTDNLDYAPSEEAYP